MVGLIPVPGEFFLNPRNGHPFLPEKTMNDIEILQIIGSKHPVAFFILHGLQYPELIFPESYCGNRNAKHSGNLPY